MDKKSKSPAYFDPEKWRTNQTYSDYYRIPSSPGIYAIVNADIPSDGRPVTFQVLYIGMSKNILKRVNNHPVRRQIERKYGYVYVYFKSRIKNLRKTERLLIRKFNPPYNLQHRIIGEL